MTDENLIYKIASKYKCTLDLAKLMLQSARNNKSEESLINYVMGDKEYV